MLKKRVIVGTSVLVGSIGFIYLLIAFVHGSFLLPMGGRFLIAVAIFVGSILLSIIMADIPDDEVTEWYEVLSCTKDKLQDKECASKAEKK